LIQFVIVISPGKWICILKCIHISRAFKWILHSIEWQQQNHQKNISLFFKLLCVVIIRHLTRCIAGLLKWPTVSTMARQQNWHLLGMLQQFSYCRACTIAQEWHRIHGAGTFTYLAKWYLCISHPADWPGPVTLQGHWS